MALQPFDGKLDDNSSNSLTSFEGRLDGEGPPKRSLGDAAKDYKVLETNHLEAALKAIGFQPRSVADVQESNALNQQAKSFYNLRAQDIRAKWASGIFEQDQSKVIDARAGIAHWNRKNPEQPMIITIPSVMHKVREMRKSKDQRIADAAPRAMRAQMKADIVARQN